MDIPFGDFHLDGGEKRGDCGKVKRKSLGAELPCSSVSIVLSARTAIRLISQDPPGNLYTLVQGLQVEGGPTLVSRFSRARTTGNFIVSDKNSNERSC